MNAFQSSRPHAKVVENKFYNVLGLQVFRYLKYKIKRLTYLKIAKNKYVRQLRKNGIVGFTYENKESFSSLEHEFHLIKYGLENNNFPNIDNSLFQITNFANTDHTNYAKRMAITYENLMYIPEFRHIKALFQDKNIRALISWCAGKENYNINADQVIWFDLIYETKPSLVSDLHVDTIHDTFKIWFFPEGIDEHNISTIFHLYSHKFNLFRLIFEYYKSCTMKEGEDRSWRLNPRIANIIYPYRIKTKYPPMSFCIANTHGFHCREQTRLPKSRFQVHLSLNS